MQHFVDCLINLRFIKLLTSKRNYSLALLYETDHGSMLVEISHLNNIVPEARIAIAHGQMDENTLSVRMDQFTAGEIDVLLSTSIIESGLDIPNANTLIVEQSKTFL